MSRPRSAPARGASSAGGRAASGRPGIFVQAPKSDVYVAMLGVALGAMILGCILLVLVLKRYDFKTKAAALLPAGTTALVAQVEKSEIPASVRL